MIVRAERSEDVAAIGELHLAGFPTDAEARLVELLRDAGNLTVSLVAEADGRVVGHVAFSPVSALVGAPGVGLAPVAVRPSHRRRGIASELIVRGRDAADQRRVGAVLTGVRVTGVGAPA